MQDQESKKQPGWFQPSIRIKIILPYILLTWIIAVLGIYVVTRLVVSSIDDLLSNALLEAGRTVSDDMALREIEHLEVARAIAFTTGLNEALQDDDRDTVVAMVRPLAVLHNMECVIVTDARGETVLHTLQEDGGTPDVEGQFDTSGFWMVRLLLDAGDPNAPPKRGLVVHAVNERYYYFTALPVGLEGQVVGVVIVGTSLDTMLVRFKSTSLADVIIYLDGGRTVATTYALPEQPDAIQAFLDEFSTTPAVYETTLYTQESVPLEAIEVRDRAYRLARAPLRVGNDTLGVFAVALPMNFVVESQLGSRNTYTLIFVVGVVGVVFVGYLISQSITNPLGRLVRTSQAVAEGDLEQRTGIVSADEIGILAGTFDEMTERLAERTYALEEALGRLEAILSSIGDGVILEDLEGNQIPLNAAAENLLEEMVSDFMSSPVHDFSSPDDHDPSTIGDQPELGHWEHRRFEVGERTISARSAVVRTDDGERLGTVIVMRDVTSEVAAIRMEARISDLEELDRQKNEFISIASHELRSPLASAKTFVQNLLDGVYESLNDEQTIRLETVLERIDDEILMVNTLLDLSRLETQSRPIVRRPTNIATIIHGIVDEFRPRAENNEITLNIGTLEAETVLIDKRAIWRVLSNLLDNALKFTPSSGQVILSTQDKDGFVEVEVTDTGIGIPEDQLERIFDRFYQIDSSTTREFGGLGLGLAIAKEIIEQHDGTIWVDSQPGAGSVFHFTLPKAIAEES